MEIYFRNKSLPELRGLCHEEQTKLLQTANNPRWFEIVSMIAAIYLSWQIGDFAANMVYIMYGSNVFTIATGFIVVGAVIYTYLIFLLNVVTRKRLARLRAQ